MPVSAPTTAGQVLTSAYLNNNINSGLTYITSTTIGTGVTSTVVSNCFNSSFDNYRITISGGLASGAGDYSFQLTGITTSVYQTFGYFMNPGTATLNAYGPAATDRWLVGSLNAVQYASSFEIINPNLTKQKFMLNSSGVSTTGYYNFSGACTSTAAATGFSITSGVAMTGGTITVYGYRKV
jgi:hypothetical protein